MALAAMDSEPVCFVSERNLATLTKYRAAVKVKAEPVMVRPVALYRHAQPAPVVPDFKTLALELVDNLVDCGGVDEGVKERYLKWAEKTCRAAMLVAAPQEVKP